MDGVSKRLRYGIWHQVRFYFLCTNNDNNILLKYAFAYITGLMA
jgi:hypothetical protein